MAYDAFEIIADDLNLSPYQLFVTARQNPASLKKDIQKSGLVNLPFILAEDLLVRGSKAPVLTRGTNLMDNIDAVFRILQLEQSFVTAPRIKPNSELNNYLKTKIGSGLEKISKQIRKSEKLFALFQRAERDENLRHLINNLYIALQSYLSSPDVIAALWSSLRDNRKTAIIEYSVNAALLSMITSFGYFKLIKEHKTSMQRRKIINIGLSALFQDISIIVNAGGDLPDEKDHETESAKIAKKIGLSEDSIKAILNHHRVLDDAGNPILLKKTPKIDERILVCVNYFLRCIQKNHFDLSIDEAIYILNYYARRHFFDQQVLIALGNMGLGGMKSRIISMSADIVQKCDQGEIPYVWDINAAVPNRIICRNNSCRHTGVEQVKLYKSVLFETPDQRFDIRAGTYHHCTKLTSILCSTIVKLSRAH